MAVIRVPTYDDLSTSTRNSVRVYQRADTMAIGSFNFMEFLAIVLNIEVQDLRDSEKVTRIRQGFDDTPFLDLLPDEFRDLLSAVDQDESKQLATAWLEATSWAMPIGGGKNDYRPSLIQRSN